MIPTMSVTNTASVVSQSMQPSETLARMFDDLKNKYVNDRSANLGRDKGVRSQAGKELGSFVRIHMTDIRCPICFQSSKASGGRRSVPR